MKKLSSFLGLLAGLTIALSATPKAAEAGIYCERYLKKVEFVDGAPKLTYQYVCYAVY